MTQPRRRAQRKTNIHPDRQSGSIATIVAVGTLAVGLGFVAWAKKRSSARGGKADDAGRMLKLAYLAPATLEKLLIARVPPTVSVKELAHASETPWADQEASVFG